MLAISGYVDQVQDAPDEVQHLANKISHVHAVIGELKLDLDRIQETSYKMWGPALEKFLASCRKTFEEIEILIGKYIAEESHSHGGTVIKSIKWKANDAQMRKLWESVNTADCFFLAFRKLPQYVNV